jgi:hypothetical protein
VAATAGAADADARRRCTTQMQRADAALETEHEHTDDARTRTDDGRTSHAQTQSSRVLQPASVDVDSQCGRAIWLLGA